MRWLACMFVMMALLGGCGGADDDQSVLRVAVAANFYETAKSIVPEFEEEHGVRVELTRGSTGLLFAQIENGAPFDVFLAADERRPQLLVERSLAHSESLACYARGRLVLAAAKDVALPSSLEGWQPRSALRLAIANEKLAPYGRAAMELVRRHKLSGGETTLVRGENVSQTFNFLMTGAVDFAFVPQALVEGSSLQYLPIAESDHSPIAQFGVVLKRTSSPSLATEFLNYILNKETQARLEDMGYAVGGAN